MKKLIAAAVASSLFLAEFDLLSAAAEFPFQSDDYGFPIEPTVSTQRNVRRASSFWGNRLGTNIRPNNCSYSLEVSQISQQAKPTAEKPRLDPAVHSIPIAQQTASSMESIDKNNTSTVTALKSIGDLMTAARQQCH